MNWHKVSEELPPEFKIVLLYKYNDRNNIPAFAPQDAFDYKLGFYLAGESNCWHTLDGNYLTINSFTDWTEIEPPEESEDD